MATFGSVSDVTSITNIVKGDIPSYMNVAISTTNNQCGPTYMTSTSRYNYYVCFTGPQPFNYIPSTSVSNAALGISSTPSSPTLTSDNSTVIVVGALISGLVILGVATLVTLHLRRTARHRTKVAEFDFNRNLASQSSVMMNPLNHTRQEPITPPPPPDDTVIIPTPSWQPPFFGARPSPLLTTAPPPPPPAPFTLSSTTTTPHERVAFDPVKYAALNRSGRVLPDVARISQRSLRLPNVEEGKEEQTVVSTRSLSVDSGIPSEPHLTASVAQRKAELMRKLSTKDFKPMVARRI
jgi:hypothetical protein